MLTEEKIPEEYTDGTGAWKIAFEDVDEIQRLRVAPRSAIKMHGHDDGHDGDGQWEVWLDIEKKRAYVCPKGEEHALVNKTNQQKVFMAIKGHEDRSLDDLARFFQMLGFTVKQGSLIVND